MLNSWDFDENGKKLAKRLYFDVFKTLKCSQLIIILIKGGNMISLSLLEDYQLIKSMALGDNLEYFYYFL